MIPRPSRLALLVPALLAFAAGAPAVAAQEGRPLTLSAAEVAGAWRPVVSIDGVLRDPALLDALGEGLPLRFRFRLELWGKGTFDRLEGRREVSVAVLRNALEPGYTVEDGRAQRRFATLAECEAALERIFASQLPPPRDGRYYYMATLDVETFSLSDLEELRRWLRGEARPAVEGRTSVGRAVESGLRRTFIRLLGLPTRHYAIRSPFFRRQTPRSQDDDE